MQHSKHIRRLNEILRRELGERTRRYSWQWSEDLLIGTYKGFERTGVAGPNGIEGVRPTYEPRKLNSSLDNQWVLCEMVPPISEKAWLAQWGWKLEWPSLGYWRPTMSGGGLNALARGMEPDEDSTADLIGLIREWRTKSLADHEREIVDNIDQRDAAQRERNRAMVRDKIPAFGGGSPGGKQHWMQGGIGPNLHERKVN